MGLDKFEISFESLIESSGYWWRQLGNVRLILIRQIGVEYWAYQHISHRAYRPGPQAGINLNGHLDRPESLGLETEYEEEMSC